MPTATKAVPTTAVAKYDGIFRRKTGFLAKHNVERDEVIELMGYCTVAGVDPLLLGDPGVGKTWLLELLVEHALQLGPADLFNILLTKEMSRNEILGPPDVMALKQGIHRLMMDGYLPMARFAYLDEVFKCSPTALNALLDILAKRQLKVGGKVIDCSQLITMYTSSNELPDREDLRAMRDRIALTYFVQPVRSPEGRRAVTDIQLHRRANGVVLDVDPLTLDDIDELREFCATSIDVNEAMRETMGKIEEDAYSAGHEVSQRRKGQCWDVVKACAMAKGRDHVISDDFVPIQHMLWNLPDDVDSARKIVLEYASVFARKANLLRETLEPVLRSMEDLKRQIDQAATPEERDDLLNGGFSFMRQLKTMQRDVKTQIKDGESQGQDVSTLETVKQEIDGAHSWAVNALSGTDEDDE